jgi:hypothetical protein
MLIATLVLSFLVLITTGVPSWPVRAPLADGQRVVGATCEGNTRITDGDWHRDLFLPPRVSVSEATLIIRAIRRSDVLNRQARATEGPMAGIATPMPRIDADQVTSIHPDHRAQPGARAYRVETGCMSGKSYRIVIVDGKLELRAVSMWIS